MDILSKDLIIIISKFLNDEDILNLSSVNSKLNFELITRRKRILIPRLMHRCYTEGIRDGYILSSMSIHQPKSTNGFFYNDKIKRNDIFYIGRQNMSIITKYMLRYLKN